MSTEEQKGVNRICSRDHTTPSKILATISSSKSGKRKEKKRKGLFSPLTQRFQITPGILKK